jgi:hypothetical protein
VAHVDIFLLAAAGDAAPRKRGISMMDAELLERPRLSEDSITVEAERVRGVADDLVGGQLFVLAVTLTRLLASIADEDQLEATIRNMMSLPINAPRTKNGTPVTIEQMEAAKALARGRLAKLTVSLVANINPEPDARPN